MISLVNSRRTMKKYPALFVFFAVFSFLFLSGGLIFGQNQPSGGEKNSSKQETPNKNRLFNLGNKKQTKQKPANNNGKVPTPSALPSQRLASQAPNIQKGSQQESCMLKSARAVGSTDIVEIGLEASGTVRQSSAENAKPEEGTMEVVAGFRYEEMVNRYQTAGDSPRIETFRQYEQAGMKRNYQGTVTRPLLDSSRKNVVCQFDGKEITEYSIGGPFKNDQYLLISELPANTALLDLLLPNRETNLGEEWTISDSTLCALLGWDAVENNTVRLVLTAIIDDMAQVDLFLGSSGNDEQGNPLPSSLQGASLGASITADIQGKYQFDLKSKRMTWFGLSITEQRSESLVEPELDWKATVRIRIAPLEKPEKLTDDQISAFRKTPEPVLFDLLYNGQKGPWSFRHSRKWRMIEDGEKSAALAFISGGEGIAQCNVLSNGKIELASMPTLDAYKEELKKGLGERFGRFSAESEYTDTAGNHVLAVMADGQYEEIPFRWIYYLLTDAAGHQVTVMFEIRAEKLAEFGDSGREIVDSFQMLFPDDSVSEKEGDFERILPEDKPEEQKSLLETPPLPPGTAQDTAPKNAPAPAEASAAPEVPAETPPAESTKTPAAPENPPVPEP